ncbi:MAG: agmatinase [Chloroflexota bacterium]
MRTVPPSAAFWGSQPGTDGRAHLLGAPLDLTGSGRLGTGAAPPAIRRASHNIESYSPVLHADLAHAALNDHGDLDLGGLALEPALVEIERAVSSLAPSGMPVLLGGEHTLTLGAVRAVRSRHQDLVVISFDAHLDLADELDGQRLAHGTWARRMGDQFGLGGLVLLGARSGTADEWHVARTALHASESLDIPPSVRRAIADRPVYLTIDIDVVDPAGAPGTGCPEPGGPSSRELLAAVHALADLNVVAMDVNEVLPEVDPAGIAATLAAKLVRECVIQWDRGSGR